MLNQDLPRTPAQFSFRVPTFSGDLLVEASAGTAIVFVGANGSGKSRLGVRLELDNALQQRTLRVSAHRALQIPNSVSPQTYDDAYNRWFYGAPSGRNKEVHKWQQKPATLLQNDFGALLTTLFSEDYDQLVRFKTARDGAVADPPESKLDRTCRIWEMLLPHRQIVQRSGSLQLSLPNSERAYPAAEASDGERVILYLIGQCLLAPADGIVIVDEPELHIHPALPARLWTLLESERRDCLFIYITHDLHFAKSRLTENKFLVREFDGSRWNLERLPPSDAFPEEVLAEILGSRHPILFVEGERGGVDAGIYTAIYPSYTVIPIGNCAAVIRAVAGLRGLRDHYHVDGHGLIDSDARTSASELGEGVHLLPFTEIENVFLHPAVVQKVCLGLHYTLEESDVILDEIRTRAFDQLEGDAEGFCLRRVKRRLTEAARSIAFSERTLEGLYEEHREKLALLDVHRLWSESMSLVQEILESRDFERLIRVYDNKALVRSAGERLGLRRGEYLQFVLRMLRQGTNTALVREVRSLLPQLPGETAAD